MIELPDAVVAARQIEETLANQQMAAALKLRRYDYRFTLGRDDQSLAHGGVTLPSALRWLWREER